MPSFPGTVVNDPIGKANSSADLPGVYGSDLTLNDVMPWDKLVYVWKKSAAEYISLSSAYSFNKRNIHPSKPPDTISDDFLAPYIEPPSDSLRFESRFECGNLGYVCRVSASVYNLVMTSDTNSRGHTQWFFFRVSGTAAGQTATFNLINFEKSASLYNEGMKVLYYSSTAHQLLGTGWRRGGEAISYFKNGIRRHVAAKSYFTLTFTFTFDYAQDYVYFAYSCPYSYSQLQEYLDSLEASDRTYAFVTRKLLCRTVAGNRCDFLTITCPGSREETERRQGVVLSARVHPGETVGSWMMQGVLEFLVSDAPEADLLRKLFVFKVVPMLNPDGVITGNHRCSLAGCDLNRRWKHPSEVVHPVISSFKRLIKLFAAKFKVTMVCDLHGHSRKPDIFMYGCNVPSDPGSCKLFPYILSKVSSVFSFAGCRFNMHRSKEATMRITMFKDLKIPCVYTCEASFRGASTGQYAGQHYTTDHLKQMGKDLCLALLVHTHQQHKLPQDHHHLKVKRSPALIEAVALMSPELMSITSQNWLQELQSSEILLHHGEVMDSSDDSDSAPSEDDLPIEEMLALLPRSETKRSIKLKTIDRVQSLNRGVRLPLSKNSDLMTESAKLSKMRRNDRATKVVRAISKSPPPRQTPATPKPTLIQVLVGVKTYYNSQGRKIHDQSSQTPPEFYKSKQACSPDLRNDSVSAAHDSQTVRDDTASEVSAASKMALQRAQKDRRTERPYMPQQVTFERSTLQSREFIKSTSALTLGKALKPIRLKMKQKHALDSTVRPSS
jgi:hypothetical protein